MLNAQGAHGPGMGARFLLGGTTVHNSRTFLDMVQDAASRFPSSVTRPPPGPSSAAASATSGLSVGPVGAVQGAAGGVLGGLGGALDADRLGEAAGAAVNIGRGLFDSVRKGVEGIHLP